MATLHYNIRVIDSVTSLPIPDADVYCNGSKYGSTDINGNLGFTGAVNATLNVKFTNYNDYYGTLDSSNIQISAPLIKITSSNASAQINASPVPDSSGASITITSTTGPYHTTGTIGGEGIYLVILPKDKYAVTVSKTGYTTAISTLDTTSGTGTTTVTLVKVIDPAIEQASKYIPIALTPASPSKINLRAMNYEFIPPDNIQGKYFTSTQARMYIGNLFIDELHHVLFELQDNKVPIFGYRSRFFDAVGQGRSIVQGMIGINFISEGYLIATLQNYQDVFGGVAEDEIIGQLEDAYNQQAQLTQALPSLYGTDLINAQATLTQLKQDINDLVSGDPSTIDSLRQKIMLNASAYNSADTDYNNAVYKDIPFDIEVDFTGGGRTVTRRLEYCFLTGNNQQYNQDGEPILDNYSFIARRLK